MKTADARAGVCLEIQHRKPSHFTTPPQMPAPLKNRNAYRHGLRSNQTSDPSVNQQLRAFRRSIREELAGVNGLPTLAQEALLQSAARHETRALLAGHYLRREPKLPIERRLELLATISAATAERDKVLKQLGILGTINGKASGGSELWDSLNDESPASPVNASGHTPPTAEPSTVHNARQTGSHAIGEPIPPLATPANGEFSNEVSKNHQASTSVAELPQPGGGPTGNRTGASPQGTLASEAR